MTKKKQPQAAKSEPTILENGALLVYSYHPETGEFVGTDMAFPDPLTPGEYLIPAGATDIAPPEPSANEVVRFVNGAWVLEAIVQTPPNTEAQAEAARAQRNGLLFMCDWTQLPDVPLSIEVKADWAEYRQALRDVPQQSNFPTEIIWPTQP